MPPCACAGCGAVRGAARDVSEANVRWREEDEEGSTLVEVRDNPCTVRLTEGERHRSEEWQRRGVAKRGAVKDGSARRDRRRTPGGDERAVGAGATRDRTASRGDAQSRPSQSSADIRAITLSTVLKISGSRARAVLVGTR